MSESLQRFTIPNADQWEIWSEGTSVPQSAETPKNNGIMESVGIPSRYLLSLSLWFIKTEDASYDAMIRLQLERRGLLSGNTVYDWKKADETESKVLLLICILASELPEEICIESTKQFVPSVCFRTFPENQLTLFLESQCLVAVAAHQGNITFFQSLGDTALSENIQQEIHTLLFQLTEERIITDCKKIVLWFDAPLEEQQALSQRIALPVENSHPPLPVLPQEKWELTPVSVRLARIAQAKRRTYRNLLFAIAAAWVLATLLLIVHFGWLTMQRAKLRSYIAETSPAVEKLRANAEQWRAMEISIDPANYPLERLYRASHILPEEGIRFTLFDQRGTNILIHGEAKDSASVFQYRDRLKNDSEWAGFQWQMAQPRLLPNNSAQFQLEGSRGYASTHSE